MTEQKTVRRALEANALYGAKTLSERELKEIARGIARVANPEMIILFGSRAYGKPRLDSDVDLLVVMDKTGSQAERTKSLRELFSHTTFNFDIHARTPDELTLRLEMGDPFIQDIVGKGVQIYPGRGANGFAARARQALLLGKTHPKENSIVVHEWVDMAEGDFEGARMWSRKKQNMRPEKLCWDCQQCVEKYLKAFLTRHRAHFERSHKLEELLDLCVAVDTDFRLVKSEIALVDICQPKIRYPGNAVSNTDARNAFAATKKIRKFARAKLGLR